MHQSFFFYSVSFSNDYYLGHYSSETDVGASSITLIGRFPKITFSKMINNNRISIL
jgi:hypothetical protein